MRKPKDKALIEAVPLMKCGNKIEYMQRLNWLSEGMLRNHLEHIPYPKINQAEIEQYRRYKEAT